MALDIEDFWKKLLIGLGIMFLPFSWTELQFSLLGVTAEATVTQVSQLRGRTRAILVEYRFADPSGSPRTEEDRLPPNLAPPSIGKNVDIQYCAGLTGQSRLVGNSNRLAVYLFLSLIFGGFSVAEMIISRTNTLHRPLALLHFAN